MLCTTAKYCCTHSKKSYIGLTDAPVTLETVNRTFNQPEYDADAADSESAQRPDLLDQRDVP